MIFKTNLAKTVWQTKYQYAQESQLQTFRRIAKSLSSIERDREYWEKKFFQTLVNFNSENKPIGLKCTMGGRITANLGTRYKNATLLNCYISGEVKDAIIKYNRELPNGDKIKVQYKTDKVGDDMKNIMLTLLEQTLTLGQEGGWGSNFSWIRPRGSIVGGVGVEHPGVVKFLEMFDKTSEVIVAGNNDGYKDPLDNHYRKIEDINKKKKQSRKGAQMCVLNIDHPDIQEYILAKKNGGRLTKFNLSVMVTNKFLEAVEKDELFELKFNGILYKKIMARELYDLIMESTYNRAEPGILFYDNMQANNPLSYLGDVIAVNPCGEIPGNQVITTVCLLGSLNLTQYVKENRTFNFESFKEDIGIFTRMLDNINDLHKKDLPAYLWAVKNIRQFGMGLNGFGSMLYMMGISYNSLEAIDIAHRLNQIKLDTALYTSAMLAKEKGKAEAFSDKYFETNYWKVFLKGKLSEKTRKAIRKYGLRNLKVTTSPPLGNSSVVCDNISNGLEPVFMHEYNRTYITEDWPKGYTEKEIFQTLKKKSVGGTDIWEGIINNEFYYYEPHNRGLCKIETVYDYGYNWVKENYPEDLEKKYLITTNDLTVDDHLNIQEAFQKFLDQSVSKTINIPKDYPFEDFKKIYLEANKRGLLGLTTYREGTMESVLSKIEEKKEVRHNGVIKNIKLPNRFINGPCEVINREGQKFYIHFSYMIEDENKSFPIAVWIQSNQKPQGEAVYVNRALKSLEILLNSFEVPEEEVNKLEEKYKDDYPYNKIAKAVSMCLRHNLPIKNIVHSLENLEGDNISTLLTAIRKFLSVHIKDGEAVIDGKCDACGSSNLVYEVGCSTCKDCGNSRCGG